MQFVGEMRKLSALLIALGLFSTTVFAQSHDMRDKEKRRDEQKRDQDKRRSQLNEMIAMCAPNVEPKTMAKVTRVESTWDPYAIGLNRPGWRLERTPRSKAEAIATANNLLAQGYVIDMGFAQISRVNQLKFNIPMEDIFDPCINLRAGDMILTDCYLRARKKFATDLAALDAAYSCYNTGNFTKGFANGYVERVKMASPL